MSSAVNIQIVSVPNLEKIESFLKDVSYRETIEYSANFNTRLCIERRLRLPFLDPQTGVAQNHSQLFMDKRQRMPGFRQGQIYTYPAARWRKSRRQYLTKMYRLGKTPQLTTQSALNNQLNLSRFPERPFQALRKEHEALVANSVSSSLSAASSTVLGLNMLNAAASTASPTVLTGAAFHNDATHDFNGAFSLEESSSLGAAGGDTSDSKDSQLQTQQQSKDDLPKEWFYDDMDINDVDSLEEPKSPADDEYDYDPRYGNKKRRKRRQGKRTTIHTAGNELCGSSSSSVRRRSGMARSRVTTTDAALDASLEAIEAGDITGTPTTSSGSRRSRGAGTRGRRRAKGAASTGIGSIGAGISNTCNPPSPGLVNEPPSFESAAAAVGVGVSAEESNSHLRNYRKYL